MTRVLPNLWKTESKDAHRLYQLLLVRLGPRDKVWVCRAIRRLASAAGDRHLGWFTYSLELAALAELGRFDAAWSVRRCAERAFNGRSLNIRKHRWRAQDAHALLFEYGPLLFFRRNLPLASYCVATGIRCLMESGANADLLIGHIVPSSVTPRFPVVTLGDIYRAAGRPLADWPLWPRFVANVPDSWFTRTVSRVAVLEEPQLLSHVERRHVRIQNRRGRASARATDAAIAGFLRSNADAFRATDERLRTLFPWVPARRSRRPGL